MQKTILFFFKITLVVIATNSASKAQNVTLANQMEIDNFDTNIDTIYGNLTIGIYSVETNISNLLNLSNLRSVKGELTFYWTDLYNIDGVNNLVEVGELFFWNNRNLIDIDHLSKLKYIKGNLTILKNPELLNVNGLRSVVSIEGRLYISSNDKLIDLKGLGNLSHIGGDCLITSNKKMNLLGLRSLAKVRGDLKINSNFNLGECCSIFELNINRDVSIDGSVSIYSNDQGCNSGPQFCDLGVVFTVDPPCIEESTGTIRVKIHDNDAPPFSYSWVNYENGVSGIGSSESNEFEINGLDHGFYSLSISEMEGNDSILLDFIPLIYDFNIPWTIEKIEVNNNNLLDNGIASIYLKGGQIPYIIEWWGESSGYDDFLLEDVILISNLTYGDYSAKITDNSGKTHNLEFTIKDETDDQIICERELDLIILNDVSGSINSSQYNDSKDFYVSLIIDLLEVTNSSKVAIAEWSSVHEQEIAIPLTNDLNIINSYKQNSRLFEDSTDLISAIHFAETYLNEFGRENSQKMIVYSTDLVYPEIKNELITYSNSLKSDGFDIASFAIAGASQDDEMKNIFQKSATSKELAISAYAYYHFDSTLVYEYVYNNICPIEQSTIDIYPYDLDAEISISNIENITPCPNSDSILISFKIFSNREKAILAGTPVTFYGADPFYSIQEPIKKWELPCSILAGEFEEFSVNIKVNENSEIYALLNSDGSISPFLGFPYTIDLETVYSNNLDYREVCSVMNNDNMVVSDNKPKIYPNPSHDCIFISNEDNSIISYDLLDLRGASIYSSSKVVSGETVRVDLSILPIGLYFLTVNTTSNRISQRIVKI